MTDLTHLDESGAARMVDVGGKPATAREAVAAGFIEMSKSALAALSDGAKGDALAVARIAAITATKRTAELIPLCHPLALSRVSVALEPGPEGVSVQVTAATTGPTGVEMEALTGVSVALLTLYDMLKAIDRGMKIGNIRLLSKSGGRSGHVTP